MTLQTFIDTYQGIGVDLDGYPTDNPFQCMDLMHKYCMDVLQLDRKVLSASSAKTCYTTFNAIYGHELFEKIDNTPTNTPQSGDIIFWGTGTYGHVAIFVDGNTKNLTSFDQNYPEGSKPHLQSHTYTQCLGWLRYKKPEGSTMTDSQMVIEKKVFEDLVTKATKFDELKKTGIENPSDVEALRLIVKNANDTAGTAQTEADNTRRTFEDYKKRVADQLNSPQDIDRVVSAIQEILKTNTQVTKTNQTLTEQGIKDENTMIELKAEITRLQILLKQNKSLETSSLEDILTEFYRRIVRIVKGVK